VLDGRWTAPEVEGIISLVCLGARSPGGPTVEYSQLIALFGWPAGWLADFA